MKSRITIEVDFDNNNSPIIQILKADSDDVRDKLVSHFTEQLGGSSWCKIKWNGGYTDADLTTPVFSRIHISPIRPEQFKEQATIMLEQAELNKNFDNSFIESEFNKTGILISKK
jgi:hypothetical protein